MDLADWLNVVGLTLNIFGAYFLLVASHFWQETLGWPDVLRRLGRQLFEWPQEFNAALYGLFSLLIGFLLQYIALFVKP